MKITKAGDTTVIDGTGTLILTQNGYGLKVDLQVKDLLLTCFTIWNVQSAFTKKLRCTKAVLKFIWGKHEMPGL